MKRILAPALLVAAMLLPAAGLAQTDAPAGSAAAIGKDDGSTGPTIPTTTGTGDQSSIDTVRPPRSGRHSG